MMRPRSDHRLDTADLLDGLGTRRVGRQIIVLPEVDSTNSFALDRLAVDQREAADGSVVFAEYQTAGRGRLGRAWHSPRGASLLFTALLCSGRSRPPPPRLVLAGAVAVASGIERATEVQPVICWPNDIYARGGKLAGILVEVRSLAGSLPATAIGIGINCLQQASHFPPDLRGQVTSLDLEASHAVDRIEVARAVLRELDRLLDEDQAVGDDALAQAWRSRSADIGAAVTLASEGQIYAGRIIDVHPQTGLLVQLDGGGRREFDPATTTRL